MGTTNFYMHLLHHTTQCIFKLYSLFYQRHNLISISHFSHRVPVIFIVQNKCCSWWIGFGISVTRQIMVCPIKIHRNYLLINRQDPESKPHKSFVIMCKMGHCLGGKMKLALAKNIIRRVKE